MIKESAKKKIKTSFTLTPVARDMLKDIADKQGISMAAVLEIIIRDKHKREFDKVKN